MRYLVYGVYPVVMILIFFRLADVLYAKVFWPLFH